MPGRSHHLGLAVCWISAQRSWHYTLAQMAPVPRSCHLAPGRSLATGRVSRCPVIDAPPWHRRSHAGRWLRAIPSGRVATPHAGFPTGSTSATRARARTGRARTGRARTTVGSGLGMERRGNTAQAVLAIRYSAAIAGAGVRCARPRRLRGRAPTPGDRVRARPGDAWRACSCGTGEPPRNELWSIACDAAGRQFQVVLIPNWNAEHHAHLHLELTAHNWVLAR
jgi:hypothetical protein